MRKAWNKKDISEYTGKEFNYLTIIKEVSSHLKDGGRCVEAKCRCGSVKTYILIKLKKGITKSCGCYKGDKGKHLVKHGLTYHPLSDIWSAIIQRCTNPKNKAYRYYGGRGVTICDEWRNDFKPFYDWCMMNGWEKGMEVDKDIKGTGFLYSPEMCIVTTQRLNRTYDKTSKVVEYMGGSKTTVEWAYMYGLSSHTVWNRLNIGWDIERALKTPVKRKPRKQNINQQPPQVAA